MYRKRMEHMDKKVGIKKAKTPQKKKLIKTEREKRITRIIVTIVIVLLAIGVYYFIDSGSYVATVNGQRISKPVYQFFLQQQLSATEYEEGLTTQEEKDKFWTTIADGQDPYETAKREALNYSKEFMIQYIKAQEMGLKVDAATKQQVASLIDSIRSQLTDKQFKETYKVTVSELQSIYEIFNVIDKFKSRYIEENFEVEDYTEEQVKAEYNEDPKLYDSADISYIILYKTNENGESLSDAEIAEKKEKASEALSKIKQGEPIDKIIAEYTEEKSASSETGNGQESLGKASIRYSQNSMFQYYLEWNVLEWVFDNKPGDVDIVEGDYSIYVVKIEDKTAFEDVKDEVRGVMEYNASQEFYNNALESWGLEFKYNIIKNERVYDAISYN
jgi:foldase protein PrsA